MALAPVPERFGTNAAAGLKYIPACDINENSRNFFHIGEEDVASMAENLCLQGLMQPLVVYAGENGYTLLSGHTRFRAMKKLFKEQRSFAFGGRSVDDDSVPCVIQERPSGEEGEIVAVIAANKMREMTSEDKRISWDILGAIKERKGIKGRTAAWIAERSVGAEHAVKDYFALVAAAESFAKENGFPEGADILCETRSRLMQAMDFIAMSVEPAGIRRWLAGLAPASRKRLLPLLAELGVEIDVPLQKQGQEGREEETVMEEPQDGGWDWKDRPMSQVTGYADPEDPYRDERAADRRRRRDLGQDNGQEDGAGGRAKASTQDGDMDAERCSLIKKGIKSLTALLNDSDEYFWSLQDNGEFREMLSGLVEAVGKTLEWLKDRG